MENILLHEYNLPFKGIKKKIIYHFSDTHLTEYDALSSPEEAEKAKKQTAAWLDVRGGFAYAYGEPYGEAQKQSAKTHFKNLLGSVTDGDCVIIAGDMLDYENEANLRLAERELNKISCPVIAVCGNHENPNKIPDGMKISMLKKDVQAVELEDLIIIGFDDSKRVIKESQINALKDAYKTGKAVVICLHIPIMTKENEAALRKAGEYFQLNYDGCPKENTDFIKLIQENKDKTVCVLAGHLHFMNNTHICDGVMQYVSTQGITGNLNKYVIGE